MFFLDLKKKNTFFPPTIEQSSGKLDLEHRLTFVSKNH